MASSLHWFRWECSWHGMYISFFTTRYTYDHTYKFTCVKHSITFGQLGLQTSIEFYINLDHKYRLAEEQSSNPHLAPMVFANPFDEGWRKNIRRVFGDVPWYRDLLPSWREPPQPKYPVDAQDIQDILPAGRGNNAV
jgi:hypothetical protein